MEAAKKKEDKKTPLNKRLWEKKTYNDLVRDLNSVAI